ncbi:MAG: hypothetical protein WCF28_11265 [Methanobacterium sp.]
MKKTIRIIELSTDITDSNFISSHNFDPYYPEDVAIPSMNEC